MRTLSLLRRRSFVAVLFAAGIARVAVPAFAGEDSSLSPSGPLHRVISEPATGGGTRISHIVQYPDGSTSTRVLTGTEDLTPDIAPSISAEPTESGRAVAVWVRKPDDAGQIAVCIYDGFKWGTIKYLQTPPGQVEADPKVIWGASGILHVMWRVDLVSTSQYWWAQLDCLGRPLSGPAQAPEPTEIITEYGGLIDPESPIGSSDVLFSFARPSSKGGGLVLFGGRDEPNPIGCATIFALPRVGNACDTPRAFQARGRTAFTFRSAGKVYYTIRDTERGVWTPYRSVALSTEVPESRAFSLIREMAERIRPPATP